LEIDLALGKKPVSGWGPKPSSLKLLAMGFLNAWVSKTHRLENIPAEEANPVSESLILRLAQILVVDIKPAIKFDIIQG